MDTALDELASILEGQDYPHKQEYLEARAARPCQLSLVYRASGHTTVAAAQLLHIYRRRTELLRTQGSTHARALAKDVDWLCAQLEAAPSARVAVWIVGVRHPHRLSFAIDAATNRILGCIKVISHLDVTAEEWGRVWSAG